MKIKLIIRWGLIIFIFCELIFFFYLVPMVRLKHLVIKPHLPITHKQVYDILQWNFLPLYWQIDPIVILEKLQNTTGYSGIQVSKQWPNTLILDLISSDDETLFYVNFNDKPYAYIWSTFSFTLSVTEPIPHIPFIDGLDLIKDKNNITMSHVPSWINTLHTIKIKYPSLYQHIQQCTNSTEGVVISFDHLPYQMLVLPVFNSEAFVYKYRQLEILNKSGFKNTQLLDMRTDHVVYKENAR
jgi:hypothetical protein